MRSRISKVSFMEICHLTSLFSMETRLENLSNRKLMKFWAKKVFGSMLSKSVVFEIWEPKDHRSLHRSRWQALGSPNHFIVFPPENTRFSHENAWEFTHDPSTSEKCVFRRRKFFFRNKGISLSIDFYGRKHDLLTLISQKLLLLGVWTWRPFLLKIS